jgi:hypothetical protein
MVDEAKAFMEELSVDIAAEKIPATIKPVNPAGRCSMMNVEKTSSAFIERPSKKIQIPTPSMRKIPNWKNARIPLHTSAF